MNTTHMCHQYCPHCHASLPAPRSRLLGWLVVGLAWTVTLTMVFGAILTGFFIMFLFPFLFAGGASLVTTAHAWAFQDRICDACGKVVDEPCVTVTTELEPVHAA